jgi:isopenicillin N synthase-like dioxygenase
MVATIPLGKDEAMVMDRAVVGQESDAKATMNAVQAMAVMPTTMGVNTDFILQPSEQATLVPHQHYSKDIPVIDFSGLQDEAQRDATIEALVDAAASWGVFQIVNHGMPASVLEGVETVVKEFFAIPQEEQMDCAIDHTKGVMQGYRPMSEVFQRTASWSNQLNYILRPQHLSATKHEYPSKPAKFRATAEEYGKELNKVLTKVTELLLEACLGTTSGKCKADDLLGPDHMQVLRINAYEPCPQPDVVMGLRSHVDNNLVTGLLQDDTGGLQVEKDGQWHGVAPLRGAIVIMMGTAIQMITNDNIKAVNHRALVNGHTSRVSVASAVHPPNYAIVCPAPELVDDMHPALYRPCKYEEFRLATFKSGALKSFDVLKTFSTGPVPPSSQVADEVPIADQYEMGGGRLRDHMMSFDRQGILAA